MRTQGAYSKQVREMEEAFIYLSNRLISISLVGRVFANGPGDLVSISGHVIPKTLKMVLDTSLLNKHSAL